MSRAPEKGSPPPELALAPDFPGLGEDDGRGPYVDHGELRAVVKRLRKHLGTLRGNPQPSMSATWSGPGTVGEVAGLGNVGPAETGAWEVASSFGYNTKQAYEVFGDSYYRLLEQAERWADAVEQAISNYEKGHIDSSA
ncbi:hypothetical protein SAMN05421874_106100 [Nonomuraea maritima]|uniref:Uncharacterized protein n=1 Tax=Nonomuraea maritima TaxID=683260 RepID=A0A1G9AA04_9ACTN|nr:hypothetical protein [Nonomuraea maritima]SDK24137.1 hypothetical protein SAMN05421874_106100 [Nonomuraea maritima]